MQTMATVSKSQQEGGPRGGWLPRADGDAFRLMQGPARSTGPLFWGSEKDPRGSKKSLGPS